MTHRAHDRRSHLIVTLTAVALGALRLVVITSAGPTSRGLDSDESIYLTAGLALGRGALPYRDVTVAQPPGLFLLLAPLGRWSSVLDALALARVGSAVAGAGAAYLIGRIAIRSYATGAAVAAMVTAASLPAVAVVERSVLTEPWLNLCTLLGAAGWLGVVGDGSASDGSDAAVEVTRRRSAWLTGVALGAALTFKFWAIGLLVPIVVTRGRRSWRDIGRVLTGALATFVVVVAPLVLAAPRGFVDQTIGYQSGRTDGAAVADRVAGVFGLGWDQLAWRNATPTVVAVLAVGLWCTRRRNDPILTFGVAWYVTSVAAFLFGPYFGFHYTAALGPAVGLMTAAVVAEAATLLATPALRTRAAGGAIIGLLVLGVANDLRWVRGDTLGRRPTTSSFVALVRGEPGTVWSPSPEPILVADRLPGTDGTGTVRVDPFAATAPGAARADGLTAARGLIDTADLIVLGPDDGDLDAVLRSADFDRVAQDGATGSSLWRRTG